MFEKTPTNYDSFPGAIYWKDDVGEFHRKHGPAVMYDSGLWIWYKNGEYVNKVNIEDDDVQIESIINEIDFKKINSVMTFLDWKWGMNDAHIPNIDELKEEAIRLLEIAKKYRNEKEGGFVMCGGFKATASKAGFTLEFIIESWETT